MSAPALRLSETNTFAQNQTETQAYINAVIKTRTVDGSAVQCLSEDSINAVATEHNIQQWVEKDPVTDCNTPERKKYFIETVATHARRTFVCIVAGSGSMAFLYSLIVGHKLDDRHLPLSQRSDIGKPWSNSNGALSSFIEKEPLVLRTDLA